MGAVDSVINRILGYAETGTDYIYDYWQFGAMFIGLILVILLIKRCSG